MRAFPTLAAAVLLAGRTAGAQTLLFVAADASDPTPLGNGDAWLEPGETLDLRLSLYNDGSSAATGVYGTLTYTGGRTAEVALLDDQASWPNLAAKGAPQQTSSPHFRLQLAATIPCGEALPFSLTVSAAGGYQVTLPFTLRVGQRTDADLLQDSLRRYNEPEATFFGADAGDWLGSAVAWGDVNADGYADLILGAPNADSYNETQADGGEVYLVYGGDTQWTDEDLAVPPSRIVRLWGQSAGDNAGYAVASGDLNGDGYGDVVVGAPNAVGLAAGAGRVYVVYGTSALLTDRFLGAFGQLTLLGSDVDDQLGYAVAVGDLDDNGYDDLVMGVPRGDSYLDGRVDAGEVYLRFGGTGAQHAIWGASAGDRLGVSLATGHVNAGPKADLVIGAEMADSVSEGRADAGEAYVIYDRPVWSNLDLAGAVPSTSRFYGADAGDFLGSSVATGDVNGDGYDDVVAGAQSGDSVGNIRVNAGEAYLIPGKSSLWASTDLLNPASGIVRFWGADASDRFGQAVACGDIDGDAYDDVIIGAYGGNGPANGRTDAGESYVVFGKLGGVTDMDLALPSADVTRVWGGDNVDYAGYAAAAGDVDGDGYDDLASGAIFADSVANGRSAAGEVQLLYGKPRSTHQARAASYSFIDASVGTELTALQCNDCAVNVPIGFSFPFYGRVYANVWVYSNGLLSWHLDIPLSATPVCMPSAGGIERIVAPFWDDLDLSSTGAVYTLLQGTAPNRRFTVEWLDVGRVGVSGTVTFEVTLFESGDILFQYKDLSFSGVTCGGASDCGATAVAGIESFSGRQGIAYSCFSKDLLGAFNNAVRFVPTVPIHEERTEHGAALWSEQVFYPPGLWHVPRSCEPNQHSGLSGWYYGQEIVCDFDTGARNGSGLFTPVIPSFPPDVFTSFYYRQQGGSTNDQAKLQYSTNGIIWTDLRDVSTDDANVWRYAGATHNPGTVGSTMRHRFLFDTIDAASNGYLGFMVDDVQVVGCNAVGATTTVRAESFAEPTTICVNGVDRVRLDAVGSACGDGSLPTQYQWRENGVDIPGATAITYLLPAAHATGTFAFTVLVTCGGVFAESDPESVTFVAPPSAVGNTMLLAKSGADLTVTWTDVPGASDYVVFQDTLPGGAFTTQTGTAGSGSGGLTVPMPAGDLFFKVAGRNPTCGVGPK